MEGTILTVIRDVADSAERSSASDFADFLEILLQEARAALARTPDLLPRLREAGVVDAGAKGFVHMLEGVVALIEGDPIVAIDATPSYGASPAAAAGVEFTAEQERFRF